MPAHDRPKFWMIWSPQGRAPTYQHTSRVSADAEAERLAKANPGAEFFVLKAVSGKTANQPEALDIKITNKQWDDGIPF